MRAALLLLVACAVPPAASRPPCPIVASLGETFTIASKVLGEARVINVYVPPDYATSGARYPVLYMPDGGMNEDFPHVVGSVDVSIKNDVIRPVIVVGVKNTERRRDLVAASTVPEEQQAAPHAGGNDRFRRFLRDELFPAIERRYRTTAERVLIGESFAGLFAVETMLVEPALFDAYIAADPSVWWNEQQLVRTAPARLAWWGAGAKRLYVATGDAKEMAAGVELLVGAIDRTGAPIAWTYEPMPSEHHSTIFPTAALHGIRVMFGQAASP